MEELFGTEEPGTPHFIEARREYFRRQLGMAKRELVASGLGGYE
jgi:hypothetical protein